MGRTLWRLLQRRHRLCDRAGVDVRGGRADRHLCRGRSDSVLRALLRRDSRAARRDRRGRHQHPAAQRELRQPRRADRATTRGRWGRRHRSRRARSTRITSARWAFRSFAAAPSPPRTAKGRRASSSSAQSMARALLAGRGSDRPARHLQQRHPARRAADRRRSWLARGRRHRRRRAGISGSTKTRCRCSTRRRRSSRRITRWRSSCARRAIRRR